MTNLKQWLKRSIPAPILRPVLSWYSKRAAKHVRKAKTEDIFTDIFKTNHWGSAESVSGNGSEEEVTRAIRAALPRVIRDYKIGSMLDAPCGDFNWMQRVDLGSISYTGGDIVLPLVQSLNERYASPGRKFIQLDITADKIPEVDLIFCRDCFIHLPFELITRALNNFRASSAKFLMATTTRNWPLNYDTCIGGIRGVDLCAWPFHLPQPVEMIEDEQMNDPEAPVRCMGLWRLDELRAMKV